MGTVDVTGTITIPAAVEMVSFDEDRIRVNEGRVEDRGRGKQGKLVVMVAVASGQYI